MGIVYHRLNQSRRYEWLELRHLPTQERGTDGIRSLLHLEQMSGVLVQWEEEEGEEGGCGGGGLWGKGGGLGSELTFLLV